MNDLEILIPTTAAMESHFRHCIEGLAANTGLRSFQVIGLALDGQILSPFRASDVQWTVWAYEGHTPGEAMLDAIERTQGVYVALLPPTHAIADKGWFSKMQLPFLRTPNCGMVVADERGLAVVGADEALEPLEARWGELRIGFGAAEGLGRTQRYAILADARGRSFAFADRAGGGPCAPVRGPAAWGSSRPPSRRICRSALRSTSSG